MLPTCAEVSGRCFHYVIANSTPSPSWEKRVLFQWTRQRLVLMLDGLTQLRWPLLTVFIMPCIESCM